LPIWWCPLGGVMPLGTFRRFMNKVLEPYVRLFVQVFLDDCWVYGSWETHFCNLKRVFYRLVVVTASLNIKKCRFKCIEGILLGHIVS
jgi:hypothetical protein